ncbi:MAG TPA: ATP-dependent DNA helicase [Chitinophagaceae bacterium]|nr:ATP-dependent DNA helicase [Chitinophagaceae bacterium]
MISRESLEKKFREEYERLNDRQREAVDCIEGPVMVIAGPGTGKTQILATRIGKILLETDSLPQNILCLTYTDAGVVAMKKRLVGMIGPDAYRVNIHTFHSFCNQVIRENLHLFNRRELEPLTDLERVQLLKKLVDGFDNDNPLKRFKGEVYFDLANLAHLFSAIKREGWEVNWLLEKIAEHRDRIIPETEGFYNKREKAKGNLVFTQKGKDELDRMEKTAAAVRAFNVYQQLLAEHRRYDYDDMINWVIRLFTEQPEVLLNYQEQLHYILVDEYQDTSGSQNRIVELLVSYWGDEPNLFVVGDDDQSIYRFQGANLANMMALAKRYEQQLKVVVLTDNYRSVQNILDGAKAVISQNESRLVNQLPGLSKDLKAAKAELQPLRILPQLRSYENEFCENADLALSIKDLIEKGVSPGSIAVVYRNHKFGDEFIKFLQLLEIPFYVNRSIDLLEDPFIRKLLNIMRYVAAELDTPLSGDPFLFEILHYDFFRIDAFRIARACSEISGRAAKTATLREYLKNLQQAQTSLFHEQDENLRRACSFLEGLIQQAYNKPMQLWFEQLINESGLLPWIMDQDDKLWLMQKLNCLFDYIKAETHRNPDLGVKEIMQNFDLMRENGLRLEFIQTTGSESGVNLLTCHGCKGLEYEHVFVIAVRNDTWEGKRMVNKGFRLPPNIFDMESEAEMVEEQRRLFYVSLTRAQKFLCVSYPRMGNDGKALIPSQFVEELRASGLEVEEKTLPAGQKLLFSSLRYGVVRKPVLRAAEREATDALLKNFSMNVTALNNYLKCPLKFYYCNLVRVPGARSDSMQFGTAVHAALNDFFRKMMDSGRAYPDREFLVNRFLYHLDDGREIFTRESLERFRAHGVAVLSKFHANYFDPAPANDHVLTEYPFSVMLESIPLKGFADKIQFWGHEIVITDFKTGDFEKARRRGEFRRPGQHEEQPHGGNYWRQAVFYRILVDNLPNKRWKVLHSQFDFVEPDKSGEFHIERVEIGPEDVEAVKQQIADTWDKIRRHEFHTGCGKPDCDWCQFAREHRLYASLIEEEPVPEEI